VISGACVSYDGPNLPGIGAMTKDRYDDILQKLNNDRGTLSVSTANTHSNSITGNGLASTPLKVDLILNPDIHNLTTITNAGVLTKASFGMVEDIFTLIQSDTTLHDLFCTLIQGCASGYCGKATNLSVSYLSGSLAFSWVPFSDNTTAQEVQFKKLSDSTWTSYATVSAVADNIIISGVAANTVYMVRIQTDCYIGGPTFATPAYISTIICPSVNTLVTHDTISFSFNYVANDFSKVTVRLQTGSSHAAVGEKNFDLVAHPATMISGSFPDLQPATGYSLGISLATPLGDGYGVTCEWIDLVTADLPFCNIPSTVNSSME
jgi:hypothetical protein